jgi:hypothetical protein
MPVPEMYSSSFPKSNVCKNPKAFEGSLRKPDIGVRKHSCALVRQAGDMDDPMSSRVRTSAVQSSHTGVRQT